MPTDYRPRLSIEISDSQARELQNLIPWGLRRQLFSIIIDDVIRLAVEHGSTFIAAVITKAIKYEEYTELKLEVQNVDRQHSKEHYRTK